MTNTTLGFNWNPRVNPALLDRSIYFGGSFRYDSDVELTMVCGSLLALVDQDESGNGCDLDDAREAPLAHAIAYAWDGDLTDESESFLDCLDAISTDTCHAATLLVESMNQWDDDMFDFLFGRVIVLDVVEVAPAVRGRGLGKQVAAYTLHAAGAWTDGVLVAAISGTREPHNPCVAPAAVGVCAALGLERFGTTSLWVGNTATRPVCERMGSLLSLDRAPVRRFY